MMRKERDRQPGRDREEDVRNINKDDMDMPDIDADRDLQREGNLGNERNRNRPAPERGHGTESMR